MTKAFPTAETFFFTAPTHLVYTLIVNVSNSETSHEFENFSRDEVMHLLKRAKANGHILYVTYFTPSFAEDNIMLVSLDDLEY